MTPRRQDALGLGEENQDPASRLLGHAESDDKAIL